MYKKLRLIQSGTFGTVYKAWSTEHNCYVALKITPKYKTSEASIQNEYDVMKVLSSHNSHPNICSMLDFYTDDSYYVMVLEYCECGDLYDFLDIAKSQGTPSSSSLIQIDMQKIIKQLYSAISFAHSLGIAHRDIKPENVLLTINGDVKLADWGHAIQSTKSNDFQIGTDNYRAPETFSSCFDNSCFRRRLDQLQAPLYNTYKADYWSLGATIFYLMFGDCLFRVSKSKKSQHLRNLKEFEKNPFAFIYEKYVVPRLPCGYNDEEDLHMSLQQTRQYFWQDLPDIYDVFHLCKIMVDTLLIVSNAEERSMEAFINQVDFAWNKDTSIDSSFNYQSKINLFWEQWSISAESTPANFQLKNFEKPCLVQESK
ncbi:fmp48p [Saccharomyces arboricola H-6]|uniref:Fmp48p n=1 Tax=Saccharomyces arboricola (strain H-6 / AS 2.3317 / CBS 10644) TaxID=1160507 RepID=J8Q7V2_SACAR|nr:fmp48p [Saccharomyces arboricola H-6]